MICRGRREGQPSHSSYDQQHITQTSTHPNKRPRQAGTIASLLSILFNHLRDALFNCRDIRRLAGLFRLHDGRGESEEGDCRWGCVFGSETGCVHHLERGVLCGKWCLEDSSPVPLSPANFLQKRVALVL